MIHEAVSLTDFADFKNGKALKAQEPGDVPVYGSNGQIGLTEEALGLDAVIVGRVGAYCGAIHAADGRFWASDNTIVARPRDGNSLKYLYYLLKNTPLREYAGGAAQPLLTHSILSGVRVRVHGPNEQAAIADILSAYDDLIENNRRRIALLEEAARLLYREWFVHFRFPGYEYVKITDGLPEGWERRTLGEVAVIKKGKNITKAKVEEGQIPVVAGGLNPAYFHSTANAIGPVITVSASGANAGYVSQYHSDIWASDCSYLSITENPELWFLYLTLKLHQVEITGMQQGAAQPHVYPKHLARLSLVSPAVSVRKHFHESVEAIFQQIANLETQSQKLAQARDLLLPRLMNGEIAV